MSGRTNLSAVAAALQTVVSRQRLPVIVSQSEDGRMVTAMPEAGGAAPADDRGLKNPRREVPPGKSFELSVLLRPVSDRAGDQRFFFPGQTATFLTLEGDARTGLWTQPAGPGDEVVVRLALGQSMTKEEAVELLRTIERPLASLGGGAAP